MKKSYLFSGIGWAFLLMGGVVFADAPDWEQVIADRTQAASEILYLRENKQMTEVKVGVFKTRFAGSREMIELEVREMQEYFRDQAYDRFLDAAGLWLPKSEEFPDLQSGVLQSLGQMLYREGMTDAQKEKAFELIAPRLKYRAWLADYVRNYVLALPLSAEERYQLASKLEATVSEKPMPRLRERFWVFTEGVLKEGTSEQAHKAAHLFLERHGEDHPEGHAARRWLLENGGDKDALMAFQNADKQAKMQADEILATFHQAVEGGDAQAASSAMQYFCTNVPAFERNVRWPAIVRMLDSVDWPLQQTLLETIIDKLPPGSMRDGIRNRIVGGSQDDSRQGESILRAMRTLDDDRGLILGAWRHVLVHSQVNAFDENPLLKAEAFYQASQVLASVELWDVEAEFLYHAALIKWGFDREQALIWLKKAAQRRDFIPEGAKAGWFAALLENKHSLLVTGEPRPYKAPAQKEEPHFPIAKQQSTSTPLLSTQRTEFDPREDLVDLEKVVDQKGAAVDLGQASWQPSALPETLFVPLKKKATIDRVEVDSVRPVHLVVSLLGENGEVLTRVQREWSFWEYLPSSHLLPENKIRFKFTPVDGVEKIRLEVYGGEGTVAVENVRVFGVKYPLQEWVVGAKTEISPGHRSIALQYQVDEAEQTVRYHVDGEEAVGYPMMRWLAPWKKFGKGPAYLPQLGGNVAFQFYGDAVSVEALHPGGLTWNLDHTQQGVVENRETEKTRYPLVENLDPGLHILHFTQKRLKDKDDEKAPFYTHISAVEVVGHARAKVGIRFSSDGKAWSEWLLPPENQTDSIKVAIPESVHGTPPRFFQTGIYFDSRATRGEASAKVTASEATLSQEAGDTWIAFSENPRLRDEVEAAAKILGERGVTVVYPKNGSESDYKAAKELAEYARVYLISDDIGLNSFPVVPLAVGTPLRHRFNRQLLATKALWGDRDYLNNPDGLILLDYDKDGKVASVHVTGETPQAVARAAARLKAATKKAALSDVPFRVVSSHVLEVLNAWDMHTDRSAPDKLSLRMGRNDRRSLQFGIVAEQELKDLHFESTDLLGPQGARLPASAIQIRAAAFYEWIPFFGDQRIPNALTENPPLPIPAKSTMGLWVTATTPEDIPPGIYEGNVRIQSTGKNVSLPFRIQIDAVKLPRISSIPTYSFAQVPYWFAEGSPLWEKAVAALAENEAQHGVSFLSGTGTFKIIEVPSFLPTSQHVGDEEWGAYQKKTSLSAGDALELQFATPTPVKLITVGVEKADAPGEWHLEGSSDQGKNWKLLGKAFLKKAERDVLFFKLNEKLDWVRLRSVDHKNAEIRLVRAFTEEQPFHADFSLLEKQMDIADEVYRKQGLPLPTYMVQNSIKLRLLPPLLFGISDGGPSCAYHFAKDLVAFTERTGRKDRLLFKVGDEPPDIAIWAEMARPYREGGLRTMTCHSDRYPDIDVAIGLMDPWVPNYEHKVRMDFFLKRKAAGDRLWWYICGVPKNRLTGTPIESLPFYWLTAKWGMQGAMNYAALHANYFSMPVPFRYEHGLDHRILQLPDGSILDTTRRELESDGIRDMELILYIQKTIKNVSSEKAKVIDARLKALLAEMVPFVYGYAETPKAWFEARNALYEMAEEVQK